jgi:hypothetical protein
LLASLHAIQHILIHYRLAVAHAQHRERAAAR